MTNKIYTAAKVREALKQIHDLVNSLDEDCGVDPVEIRDIARAALASPPRNCDVGTAAKQSERYEKFCYAHRSREKGCGDCPLCDIPCCEFGWAQMPYEEGGAK